MHRSANLLCTALLATGCIGYDDGEPRPPNGGGGSGKPSDPTSVQVVAIDPGELIDVAPGDGAGVFVEYIAGGEWHVFTTCDTGLSGFDCEWDIIVSIERGKRLALVDEEDLESTDDVIVIDDGAVRLLATNGFGFDGLVLESPPGEVLRIDVLLDGVGDPRFVNWIGGGTLHQGAPSNPLDLEPVSP